MILNTSIHCSWVSLIMVCLMIRVSSQLNQKFSAKEVEQISMQYQHKFPISIQHSFSKDSDMSVVMTSCNRPSRMEMALNSLFHFNTYILNKVIIIEDCLENSKLTKSQREEQIWSLLPSQAKQHPQYFTILINDVGEHGKLGQIGSIDRAYAQVKTKYVYHLQDDWIQVSGYGILERMKDSLIDAKQKGLNVSQVIQTVPNWGWNHYKGPLKWTQSHKTKYYQMTSYGKQWLYHFSFNPHLLDYQQIYIKILRKSLVQSVAERYHCIKQGQSADSGCVQKYLGELLNKIGYKQIYMQQTQEEVFKHIGTSDFVKPQVYEFQIQATTQTQQQIQQETPHQQGQVQIYFVSGLLIFLLVACLIKCYQKLRKYPFTPTNVQYEQLTLQKGESQQSRFQKDESQEATLHKDESQFYGSQ